MLLFAISARTNHLFVTGRRPEPAVNVIYERAFKPLLFIANTLHATVAGFLDFNILVIFVTLSF